MIFPDSLRKRYLNMREFGRLSAKQINPDQLLFICLSKQREGKSSKSEDPIAVVVPYCVFKEWMDAFQYAESTAKEMYEHIFGRVIG